MFIVLIQVCTWEIRHHSTVCRCGLVDYEQSLSFFLVRRAKRPGHAKNDHARPRARALPLLNLKKKRDCSQSSGLADILYFERYYVSLLLAGNSFYLIGYLFSLPNALFTLDISFKEWPKKVKRTRARLEYTL